MSERTCAELGACQSRKMACPDCPNHTYMSWKCTKCGMVIGLLMYADRTHDDCKQKDAA